MLEGLLVVVKNMLIPPICNTGKTPEGKTSYKSKTFNIARGAKAGKEKLHQCLTSLQLPKVCPSLSRRCSAAQFFEMINEQNTRTILSNPPSLNANHMLKKQALNSVSENTIDFHPALPFLLHGITKSHKYSV